MTIYSYLNLMLGVYNCASHMVLYWIVAREVRGKHKVSLFQLYSPGITSILFIIVCYRTTLYPSFGISLMTQEYAPSCIFRQ
jgi:hypothetical protein